MKVAFSFLDREFSTIEDYLSDIRSLVRRGEFTLGESLDRFEERFASLCGVRHAIGVASGTDAITLSLKALGIGVGCEVITSPTTSIATVGAIVLSGARPVFVDTEEGFVIDPDRLEEAIGPQTRAVVPVHFGGNMADMCRIGDLANKYQLAIVEDACHALGAALSGTPAGSWGSCAAFSLHPIRNLNVWGDGGLVVTNSTELSDRIRLLRNHGLVDRDHATVFGHNSRLDTLHAIVANRLLDEFPSIVDRRIAIADKYDRAFGQMTEVVWVPPRRVGVRHVFHLYILRVRERDRLLEYLRNHGVEAKVHYPIPVHLQDAAKYLGYRVGDFPASESDSANMITLPLHQSQTEDEINFVIDKVKSFYQLTTTKRTAVDDRSDRLSETDAHAAPALPGQREARLSR